MSRNTSLFTSLSITRSRLPQVLTLLYALCIIYASLYPFIHWEMPADGTPYWLIAPTRFHASDFWVNLFAYVPLGFFAGLAFVRHAVLRAVLCGIVLSFAMESCQWWMPPRDADLYDLLANVAGTAAGGAFAWGMRQWTALCDFLEHRRRLFLDGWLGDFGLALIVFWLAAQSNPVIPLFSIIALPDTLSLSTATATDAAWLSDAQLVQLTEAMIGALQIAGIGLFALLLTRHRRHALWVIPALLTTATILKQTVALLMLHADALLRSTWRLPTLTALVIGLLLLYIFSRLSRPKTITVCAVILLSSLLAPLLLPELWSTRTSLAMFNDRYAHLLHFNGLTHTILLGWPLAASLWLFLLAGRPHWGAHSTEHSGVQ